MALNDLVQKLILSSVLAVSSACTSNDEEEYCTMDSDCKGDRICSEEGYCMDANNSSGSSSGGSSSGSSGSSSGSSGSSGGTSSSSSGSSNPSCYTEGCEAPDCVFYDPFEGDSLDLECRWWAPKEKSTPSVNNGNLIVNKDLDLHPNNPLGGKVFFSEKCAGKDLDFQYRFKWVSDVYDTEGSGVADILIKLYSNNGDDKCDTQLNILMNHETNHVLITCPPCDYLKLLTTEMNPNLTSYTAIQVKSDGLNTYLKIDDGEMNVFYGCGVKDVHNFLIDGNFSDDDYKGGLLDYVQLSCH